MTKRKTNLLVNFLVLLITLVLMLVFFEVALRVLLSDQTVFSQQSDLLTYDPIIGVGTKPNLNVLYSSGVETSFNVRTNSLGWRDDNITKEKSKKYRIIVYGDSFTYGVGVDQKDIFTERLERDHFWETEVINFGLIASGTAQQFIHFQEVGKYYPADAIILVFFVGNDILDNGKHYEKRPYFDYVNNGLQRKNFPPPLVNYSQKDFYPFPLNIHAFLARHSYVYTFFYKRALSFKFVRNLLQQTEFGRNFILLTRGVDIYLTEEPTTYTYAKNVTRAILKQFSLATSNTPFYVVLIPTREQINDDQWEAYTAAVDYNLSELDRMKPITDVLAMCKDLSLTCINLYPVFAASTEPVYFSVDAHTNAHGHYLIAEAVSERLINDQIVK